MTCDIDEQPGVVSLRFLRIAPANRDTNEETNVADSLPAGGHLTTPRRGFVHHGIYVGGGRVIHYAGFGPAWRRGLVEEVALEQFTRGRGYAVKAWVAPKYSGSERVERARSRLGEDRYRIWSNNCEHFSLWVISGSSRSLQVESWQSRIAALLPWRVARGRSGVSAAITTRG